MYFHRLLLLNWRDRIQIPTRANIPLHINWVRLLVEMTILRSFSWEDRSVGDSIYFVYSILFRYLWCVWSSLLPSWLPSTATQRQDSCFLFQTGSRLSSWRLGCWPVYWWSSSLSWCLRDHSHLIFLSRFLLMLTIDP